MYIDLPQDYIPYTVNTVLCLPYSYVLISVFPPYSRGDYTDENTRMIVSGGLGSHTVPLRLNNIPEIPVLRISASPAESEA